MSWLEDPEWLWHNTRKGREEFVQDLLAALICGGLPGKWNQRVTPSEDGVAFITRLHGRHFVAAPTGHLQFINEYQLPARHEDEAAGWPDYGIEWEDRLFLIELKSERGSHRKGQITQYREQGVHHNPHRQVDVLYVTPEMDAGIPPDIEGSVAWSSWEAIRPLIREQWGDADDWRSNVTEVLNQWLDEIERGIPLPARVAAPARPSAQDLFTDALRVAALTQQDGEQRALEAGDLDPEELEALRLEVRDAINAGAERDGVAITHVRPWIWTLVTSTGTALSEGGGEHGVELRLSRYHQPVVGR